MWNKLIMLLWLLPSVFLAVMFVRQNRQLKLLKNDYISELRRSKQDSARIEVLKEQVRIHGALISFKPADDFMVSDNSGKYFLLKELVKDGKLIYHFDETNCFSCVEKFLPFLKRAAEKIGVKNVVIIGSFDQKQNLFLTMEKYETAGIPVYNLHPRFLSKERISALNAPYIFWMDQKMEASKMFVPEKGLPELSEYYLKNVLSDLMTRRE